MPAAQPEQALAPSLEYRPAAQAAQAADDDEAPVTVPKRPAGQLEQLEAPGTDWNAPAEQAEHADAPATE